MLLVMVAAVVAAALVAVALYALGPPWIRPSGRWMKELRREGRCMCRQMGSSRDRDATARGSAWG